MRARLHDQILGALGRPRGLEYFLIGTLNGLTFHDEKTGFWLWKGKRYKLRVSLRLGLVAPGPRVTKQMPGRPVALPTASAIIAAPPSCRQTVIAMSRSWKASRAAR